jgi:hypothetical protein
VLTKKNMGILGMKTMGDKSILKSKTVTPVGVLEVQHESATQRLHHGLRLNGNLAAGSGCGKGLQAADSRRGKRDSG